MMNKRITIDYVAYASADEMEPWDRELVAAALEARQGSYSPYSKFRVGAALRLADGTVLRGANQENIAYPSGLCAERTVMFYAGANYPGIPFDTLSVKETSGMRFGSPACTTRGMKEAEMTEIGQLIARLIHEGESAVPAVREEVLEICSHFPLYPEL